MNNDFNKNLDYEFNGDVDLKITMPSRRNYIVSLLVIIAMTTSVFFLFKI